MCILILLKAEYSRMAFMQLMDKGLPSSTSRLHSSCVSGKKYLSSTFSVNSWFSKSLLDWYDFTPCAEKEKLYILFTINSLIHKFTPQVSLENKIVMLLTVH